MRAILAALAIALPAVAQQPAPAAAEPTKEAPAAAPAAPAAEAAPAPAKAPAKDATPAPPDTARPCVGAALGFLKSFSHTNRKGPEGAEAWDALRTTAADKVVLKIGGKDLVLDTVAGQSDAQLVRFSKLSTWREGSEVKGVTLERAEFRTPEGQQQGHARISMSEKDGKWVVQSIELQ